MRSCFITSPGTEIGKTFVTAALIHQARKAGRHVEAFKPVLSGFDEAHPEASDAGVLLTALGRDLDNANLNAMTPYRFKAALSPDMAAKRDGRALKFDDVIAFSRNGLQADADICFVEGVGGVMAPIDERHTVLDWVAALDIPALLVCGGYLGTISHTLTAARVLQAARVPIAGIVLSGKGGGPVPLEETSSAIARYLPGIPHALVPDCGTATDAWATAPDLLTPLGI